MPGLIKMLKSRMRHKLDSVQQDIAVGNALKQNRNQILESLMAEQNGSVVLKIKDSAQE